LKTLLYGVGKIVDLAIKATKDNKNFKMPTANKIMKSEEGKKYSSPSLKVTTTEHEVLVKQE
jgi:hypothetical protein